MTVRRDNTTDFLLEGCNVIEDARGIGDPPITRDPLEFGASTSGRRLMTLVFRPGYLDGRIRGHVACAGAGDCGIGRLEPSTVTAGGSQHQQNH
jgi:hypothetical protein